MHVGIPNFLQKNLVVKKIYRYPKYLIPHIGRIAWKKKIVNPFHMFVTKTCLFL